jgi:hypothetical protein
MNRRYELFFVAGATSVALACGTHSSDANQTQADITATAGRPVDPAEAKEGETLIHQIWVSKKLFKLVDFARLPAAWDGQDAVKAKTASPAELKALTYARYGFVEAPFDNHGLPLGLAYDETNDAVHLNCLLCHQGQIKGQVHAGLPR